MNYIVFDLEWNQSPLGKEFENKKMPFEIIEIGAVRLNEKLEETGRFHKIIKPKVYKDLHYMTKQIVHLTMDDLKKGEAFTKAMRSFLQWCGEDYIFCTWGNMDLLELQRNMNYFDMGDVYTEPMKFYDIQKFFSILHEDGKSRRTLQYVVEYLKLCEKLPYHSALNDAIYTAEVMKNIDFDSVKNNYSIDCYRIPADKKKEIRAVFDNYSKYISCGYENKDDLLVDKDVVALECHVCGRRCRKKIRWFSNNNKTYYALGICKEHGYVKGKTRVKQAENDLYYVVKTTKIVDEAGADKVRERQQLLREKRRERRRRLALEKKMGKE